mgnify:CR=1 FL=1
MYFFLRIRKNLRNYWCLFYKMWMNLWKSGVFFKECGRFSLFHGVLYFENLKKSRELLMFLFIECERISGNLVSFLNKVKKSQDSLGSFFLMSLNLRKFGVFLKNVEDSQYSVVSLILRIWRNLRSTWCLFYRMRKNLRSFWCPFFKNVEESQHLLLSFFENSK